MGRNLSTLFISQSYQFLTQVSGSELQDGLGNKITGSLLITSSQAISASFATTASFALNAGSTISTSSLLTTASAVSNVITFTKGDASTFTVTVATGSATTVSTGSLMVTGSATNNVLTFTKGDGSTFALTVATGSAVSSSYAATASLALNNVLTASSNNDTITFTKGDGTTFTNVINNVTQATSASFASTVASGIVISGSFTGSLVGALTGTASYASNALSASYALNATSASFAPTNTTGSFTGSFTGSLQGTASYATQALSASFASTIANGLSPTFANVTASNVLITGTASVALLYTQTVSSSVIYSSGSNQFGDAANDTQTLFGTVDVKTGPLVVTGSITTSGSITMVNGTDLITHHIKAPAVNGVEIQNNTAGVVALFGAGGGLGTTFYGQINGTTFVGTASLATSASYAVSASQAQNAVSASFAPTSSFALNAGLVSGLSPNSMNSAAFLTATPATSSGTSSIALGNNAISYADYSIIIGDGAHNYDASRPNAIFIGRNAKGAQNALGIGYGAEMLGDSGLAIGRDAKSNANESVTIGYNADTRNYISAKGAIAIGRNTIATQEDEINIGSRFRYNSGSNGLIELRGNTSISGSLQVTGSITATTGFTGSLLGTASFATNALTSSYPFKPSTAPNSVISAYYTSSINTTRSIILGGFANTLNGTRADQVIIGGSGNTTTGITGEGAGIFSSVNSTITNGGTGTAILGGQGNTLQDNNTWGSVVVGGNGLSSTANSPQTFMIGGASNTLTGVSSYSGMMGGQSNTLNGGTHSTIIGGQSNTLTHAHSAIIGGQSITSTAAFTVYVPNFNISGSITGSGATNFVLNTADTYTGSAAVQQVITLTQAEYNAIVTPNVNTLYIISGSTPFNSNAFATTGSNTFIGNQTISGSLIVTGSQVITGSLRGNVGALSISSNTASLDCSTGNFFTLLLVSGSNTFVNPSNILPGQTINLRVKQASIASGSISFASSVKQVSGSAYTPTATANGEDIVTFISFDSTNLYLSNIKNFV